MILEQANILMDEGKWTSEDSQITSADIHPIPQTQHKIRSNH